jgi:alpha-mannosidase
MNLYTTLIRLKRTLASEYWAERLFAQLDYAIKIAELFEKEERGRALREALETQLLIISEATRSEHVVKKRLTRSVEMELSSFSDILKKPVLHLAGHAHIDINWMWGWHETVSITLETFRSVLTLMKEYPDFTFSQSQALLYRIVEEYEPEMLPEIGRRIRQGRWELTASMWTESDMNMISGESLARHLLYSKSYLKKLFSLDDDHFKVVYLPDSFGHGSNIPEILVDGGVRYYYHCRGADDQHIYRWKAPSGKSVLTYRETKWYNDPVHYGIFATIPEFIRRYKYDKVLAVYGVGDHGGGPTRRELSRISDMKSWPLAPTIQTGTYLEYFKGLDTVTDLPEIEGERNPIFSGCSSSQSRIKRANKVSENNLFETELWQAIYDLSSTNADSSGVNSRMKRRLREQNALTESWKRTLVSQFHDILPGSGTVETREFAMGEFQKTLASTLSLRTSYYRRLLGASGPGKVKPTDPLDTAYGSGIGFGNERGLIAAVERGSGDKRRITLFNSLPFRRRVYPQVTLWDWGLPEEETQFALPDGTVLLSQLLNKGNDNYWHHIYSLFTLEVDIPPTGYQDILISPRDRMLPESEFHSYGVEGWLVENVTDTVLENRHIKASFDRRSGRITSLLDKKTGKEFLSPKGAGFEYLIEERDRKHMSSWIEGSFIGEKAADSVRLDEEGYLPNGEIQNRCTFVYRFSDSEVQVTYILNRGESFLRCNVEVLWKEIGSPEAGIPRLRFAAYPGFDAKEGISDGMNTTLLRVPKEQDLSAASFCTFSGSEQALLLSSRDGYAYRYTNSALFLTLLRSSIDPDPAPETGKHSFSFAFMPINSSDFGRGDLVRRSRNFIHEVEWISRELSEGRKSGERSFLSISEGDVHLGAMKLSESHEAIVIRLYDLEGQDQLVKIDLDGEIENASLADIHECPLEEGDSDYEQVKVEEGRRIIYHHPGYATCTILVSLKREGHG